MSKRKTPTILGPDGKPLDRAKYAPKPEPKATVSMTTADGQTTAISDEVHSLSFDVSRYLLTGMDLGSNPYRAFARIAPDGSMIRKAKPKPLAERVAADVDALTADLDFAGRPELPHPAPDLTAYADALDVAIRSCPHTDVEDTIHSRGEYQCVACGKYLSREDMRRRRSANPFGGWFG